MSPRYLAVYEKGMVCDRCGEPIDHHSGGIIIDGRTKVCRVGCFQLVNDEHTGRSKKRTAKVKPVFA